MGWLGRVLARQVRGVPEHVLPRGNALSPIRPSRSSEELRPIPTILLWRITEPRVRPTHVVLILIALYAGVLHELGPGRRAFERQTDRPRFREDQRIIDGASVLERIFVGEGPPL